MVEAVSPLPDSQLDEMVRARRTLRSTHASAWRSTRLYHAGQIALFKKMKNPRAQIKIHFSFPFHRKFSLHSFYTARMPLRCSLPEVLAVKA
jgi:hypothetical protein